MDNCKSKLHIFLLMIVLAIPAALSACDTPEDSVQPSPSPEITIAADTPTVVPVETLEDEEPTIYSTGLDAELAVPGCFDLDTGEIVVDDGPGCDFSIKSASDPINTNIRVMPIWPASFAFAGVFWEPPQPEQCLASENFSNRVEIVSAEQNYYVCYQTGEGNFGYLSIRAYESEIFRFDWLTFDISSEPVADKPAGDPFQEPAAQLDPVFASGDNQLLGFNYGIDLDTGELDLFSFSAYDFRIGHGTPDSEGILSTVSFIPFPTSGFSFEEAFLDEPTLEQCKSVTSFSSRIEEPQSGEYYVCYQTTGGRLGYIHIRDSNEGFGMIVDWVTWEYTTSRLFPVPTAVPSVASDTLDQVFLVADVDVPEGEIFQPGEKFEKSWRMINSGTTKWTKDYALIFVSGSEMQSPGSVPLTAEIAPGETVEITIELVAPEDYGTYIGQYMLQNADGLAFGTGELTDNSFYVLINVGDPGFTHANGWDVNLKADECFDFDDGYPSMDDEEACDFSISAAPDANMVEFVSPVAAFGFDRVLGTEPRLTYCMDARVSSGNRIVGIEGWYVCYRTNQDRYGWIYIKSIENGEIRFDWKTFVKEDM
ncbi:MAG: NBR1-Ig-like domain-containing protein [Anaerolineaceae bacterium]|nr:NBR1-Ig-like domain-containing protein [Anaerolineaceae bacterium]